MKVLKITSAEVAKQLDYMTIKSHRLEFALDGNGDLITSTEVLKNPRFSEIHELLRSNSEEIEYVTTENKEALLDTFSKTGDQKYERITKSTETIKK